MHFSRIFLVLSALLAVARADDAFALFRPGESLTYRVGWGMLGHAGDMKISAQAEMIDGKPHIRTTTTTGTQGLVRLLYSFDGDAGMLFDADNGRLLNASARTRAGKKKTDASITFDYARREADYTDHLRPVRSATITVPPGRPMDLITALIQTRVWALAPGQSRETVVLFDKEFYPMLITAEREETINTPQGPRKTVLLVPRMIGPPKGMFRRGGEVRVWVSADDDRLPLRFEVKLKVGTAYAVLSDYQPPAKP